MNRRIACFLISLILSPSALNAAPDSHLFVSDEYDFSVQYPQSWIRGDMIHPQTVIRVYSPGGDDFNITVVQNDSLANISPDTFVNEVINQVDSVVRILSRNYPDAKLVRRGTTKLSQQPALSYVIDYTLSAVGRELAMRSYVITTKRADKQYTLTFRTPRQFFAEYQPIIEAMQ